MGTLHAWESFGDGAAVRLILTFIVVWVCSYGRCRRPA